LAYVPALDGVRALAIIAVMLYHGGLGWLPGGFLGVDIFFVLSGYLITSLLINEFVGKGRINLKAFYFSRMRRLLPALFFMIFIVFTYSAFFMKDAVASTLRDLPWAMGGLANWFYVFHQQDYFEAIGRPILLQHTWSLAVEAQFYLVWPLVLLVMLPIAGARSVRLIAFTCAIISAGIMFWLGWNFETASSMSVSHMYFGTDTHSMGLFLGAALATAWQPAAPERRSAGSTYWGLSALVGFVALAAIVLMFLRVNEATGDFYVIGFPLVGLLSVFLIAVATHPALGIGRILGSQPLRWIGQRSYGMYLWHWPIFQATRSGVDLSLSGLPNLIFRLALTAIVAEISYRYIEMPVRRGVLARWWARIRTWNRVRFGLAAATAVGALALIIAVESVLATSAMKANASALPPLALQVPDDASPAPSSSSASPSAKHPKHPSKHRPVRRHTVEQVPALLIGDSVLLGVSPWIAHSVNVVEVDATVARQAIATQEVVARKAAAGHLQPTTIVNLGNNGTVEESTLRSILSLLKSCKHVVVVNARVPRPWQDDNDALMARVVPTYPNAALADWYSASAGHPEYFSADGVHPNQDGARAYVRVVVSALEFAQRKVSTRDFRSRNGNASRQMLPG
jgi:peptidoglycan/LPS O-acetylase OafA/YrhL